MSMPKAPMISGASTRLAPVVDAKVGEPDPRYVGAHHVQRAMGEVDDVEQPEDHGQAEAQHGVEGRR